MTSYFCKMLRMFIIYSVSPVCYTRDHSKVNVRINSLRNGFCWSLARQRSGSCIVRRLHITRTTWHGFLRLVFSYNYSYSAYSYLGTNNLCYKRFGKLSSHFMLGIQSHLTIVVRCSLLYVSGNFRNSLVYNFKDVQGKCYK